MSYRYNAAPLLPLGMTFFVNGAAYASFLPRLPDVARSLELSPSALGVVLVGGGVGGLLGSFTSPLALRRFGSARVTTVAGLVLAAGLVLIGLAPSALALAGALVLYGALDGQHDSAMNDLAAHAQTAAGRSLMGRLHAGWSGAGVVGAGVGAAAAGAGVPVPVHLGAVAVLLVAVQVGVGRRLWHVAIEHEDPVEASRGTRARAVVVLAVATVAAAVLEGGAMEWSALQLSLDLDAAPGLAGLAPTLFLGGGLLGRLFTDRVIDRLGTARTAQLAAAASGAAVALGLLGAATTGAPAVALLGWAVAGVAVAPVFPLLFTAAGGSGAAGIVSGTSRLGFLAAPPLIGGLGDLTSLTVALVLLPVAALVLGLSLPARLRGPARSVAPAPVPA